MQKAILPLTHHPFVRFRWLAAATLVLTVVVLLQDCLGAWLRSGQYYFEESFLFSSFWWLFLPFLYVQIALHMQLKSRSGYLLLILLLPPALHLLIYPLVVTLLSALFYDHTYTCRQVLEYELGNLLPVCGLLYSLPLFLLNRRMVPDTVPSTIQENREDGSPTGWFQFIPVQQGSQTVLVPVQQISCIRSSTPYVKLETESRSYLYTSTLKALQDRLDPHVFIRVHKSTLLNIRLVQRYVSRKNGDYDARLQNGQEVRVSRVYAAAFKAAFTG